jgi:hypothetical protein
MGVLGSDTFIRSNVSGSWGNATDGQVWAHPFGSATPNVTSNEGVIPNTPSTWDHMVLGSVFSSTDMEVLVRSIPSANTDNFGVLLRVASNGQTSYKAIYDGGASTKGLYLYHDDPVNGLTALTSVAFTVTASTAYWVRGRIIGTTLWGKIWQDGTAEPNTWNLTATDSTITSGGIGVLGKCSSNGKFDHFYAVDYRWAEALTIIDNFSPTDGMQKTDTVTLTDALTDAVTSLAVNTLTGTDTLGQSGTSSTTEQLTVSDLLGAQLGVTWLDSTPPQDVSAGTSLLLARESLTALDALVITETDNLAETLTAQESGGLYAWPTELLSVIDALTTTGNVTTTETIPIVEASTYQQTLQPSEQIPLLDAANWQTSFATSNISPLADAPLFLSDLVLIESLSPSEAIATIGTYSVIEATSLLDTFGNPGPFTWSETLSPSEQSAYSETVSNDEDLLIDEALTGSGQYATIDALASYDQVGGTDIMSVIDAAFVPSDSLSTQDTTLFLEVAQVLDLPTSAQLVAFNPLALSPTDSSLFFTVSLPLDLLSTSESLLVGQQSNWQETPPLSITFTIGELVSFADLLVAAEQVSATGMPVFIDILAISDQFSYLKDNLITGVEEIAISDSFVASQLASVIEAYPAADTFLITLQATFTDDTEPLDIFLGYSYPANVVKSILVSSSGKSTLISSAGISVLREDSGKTTL